MMLRFSGAVLAAVLLGVVTITGATCPAKYANQVPEHTMCLTDSPNAVEVTLTQDVKDAIVNRHNKIREEVTPAASDMMKMTWDDRLAKVATKWVMQCVSGHDKNRAEPDLPGFVGQNFAGGQSSFMNAVNAWYSEIDDWTYGVWTEATGHYVQQIFSKAYLIGCGQAKCNGRNMYACNYFSGTISNLPQYKQGTPCADCPHSCDSTGKLCECGSAPGCFNGGSLNIDTCKCDCTQLWGGDNCTTMACPREDFKDWCKWVTSCGDYYKKVCPIKCKVCPDPCGDKECKNEGTLNGSDCSCTCKNGYSGDTCEVCPPQDLFSWCSYLGGPDGCTHSYYKKVCPNICGLCAS